MRSLFPSLFHRDDPRTALQTRLDNVFDDFAREWVTNWPTIHSDRQNVFMALDVKESEESFEIKAELPDMDKDDIEVDIQGNCLHIKGEKKREEEKDEKGYHFKERSFGAFHRQIPLGFNADVKDITASYNKGVLSIHIPKPPELQHKPAKVNIEFKE